MGNLLKFLLLAVVIGLWIYIVGRSCNNPKTIVDSTTKDMGITGSGTETDVDETDLEDLYEVEESDVKDGNADSSSDEELPTNAEAADDLEMGNANDPSEDAVEEENTSTTYSGRSSGSTFGKYLVVTGSYLSEANARIMAKKLRRIGYEAAEVLSFDLSQYYSVTAGRYSDIGEARAVAKRIKSKGMEAYVHKMRGKKVGN